MDFNNYEELHKLIAEVVDEKYKIAIANITYLEEIDDKCYVIYMTQFRDVLIIFLGFIRVQTLLIIKLKS